MNAIEQRIRELEQKRKALNQKMMEAGSIANANVIERELWHSELLFRITSRH